ncbi:MAG: hypothetical protein AB1430_03440 [Pseudomonadota bacterium]
MNIPASIPSLNALAGAGSGLRDALLPAAEAGAAQEASAWFLDADAGAGAGIRINLPLVRAGAGGDVQALAQRVLGHLVEAG